MIQAVSVSVPGPDDPDGAEETRQLQTELARLRALASEQP
jgi:hypothetical protein